MSLPLWSLSGTTPPAPQGVEIQVFSFCLTPHLSSCSARYLNDLFISMSYNRVRPLPAGNGTFIVFFPETRSVSGTKIMAEYIFAKWLAHPNPGVMGRGGGWGGRSGNKTSTQLAGKRRVRTTETQNQKSKLLPKHPPTLCVSGTGLHFEHEGDMPRTGCLLTLISFEREPPTLKELK